MSSSSTTKKKTASTSRHKARGWSRVPHVHTPDCGHGKRTPATVADRVHQARKLRGLSPAALAKRAGIAPARLAELLRGAAHPSSPGANWSGLHPVATALGVSMPWLIEGVPTSPDDPLPPPVDRGPTLDAALQARLAFLAAQPPTAQTLHEMERTASLGIELLAMTADGAAMNTRRPRAQSLGGYSVPQYMSGSSYSSVDGPMASAPETETFASNIMRQMVSAVTASSNAKVEAAAAAAAPTALSLVQAIAAAKAAGLADIEIDLREQLSALGDKTLGGRPKVKRLAPAPKKPRPVKELTAP